MPFSAFQHAALYDPDAGFYARAGAAGRRGDFLTSVEVGPLFGAVVARALDAWWHELGRPEPFTVVEAGAGAGTLARTVHKAAPACLRAGALRYVTVEVSDRLRERQPDWVEARTSMPGASLVGVVLANELLDNLTIDLAEWHRGSWHEVVVDVAPSGPAPAAVPRFVEVRRAAPASWHDVLSLVPDAPALGDGARVPVQRAAQDWLRDALALVEAGRVVVFDYAVAATAELASRPSTGWLRTYRAHARGGSPLDAPGTQDVTCDVALDQLAAVAPPTSVATQAEWLTAHGIDELVAEGRRLWAARSGPADLAALLGRSRVTEAEALRDPSGLGGFTVAEWVRPR